MHWCRLLRSSLHQGAKVVVDGPAGGGVDRQVFRAGGAHTEVGRRHGSYAKLVAHAVYFRCQHRPFAHDEVQAPESGRVLDDGLEQVS